MHKLSRYVVQKLYLIAMTHLQPHTLNGRSRRIFRRITPPDMTPMAGVGFLLVSFFMLTSSLVPPTVMELAMPVKPRHVEDFPLCGWPSGIMTVLLGSHNQVYYYPGIDTQAGRKTDYSATGLRQALLSAQRAYGPLTVLVKPSNQATYQNMVDALDEMHITGQKRYILADLYPADEELLKSQRL